MQLTNGSGAPNGTSSHLPFADFPISFQGHGLSAALNGAVDESAHPEAARTQPLTTARQHPLAGDARPYVEAAKATHPSLVDTEHRVADLYNMVNVPTVVWIDEEGRIARPQDVHYVSSDFSSITHFHPRKPLAALRAWVRGEAPAYPGDPVSDTKVPTNTDQEARAAFAVAWWLAQQGRHEAADRWFVRAGQLAPHDFNIRRGSMPIRSIDPAGPAFFQMVADWAAQGKPYYLPLADTATTEEDFEIEPVEQLTMEQIRQRIIERG